MRRWSKRRERRRRRRRGGYGKDKRRHRRRKEWRWQFAESALPTNTGATNSPPNIHPEFSQLAPTLICNASQFLVGGGCSVFRLVPTH